MGQDANDAHPNIIGAVVAALRQERGKLLAEQRRATSAPTKGRRKRLSLEAFYDECAVAEKSQKQQQSRLSFKPVGEDAKVARIKRIEALGPRASDEPYICNALGLPSNFLRQDFQSTDSAVAAAREIWIPGGDAPVPQVSVSGFQQVAQDDLGQSQRVAEKTLFSWFEDEYEKGEPCLFIIQGGKGVGKSYLIAKWFWAQGRLKFKAALTLDCSGLSLDQIAPAVRQFFEAHEANARGLLVLDGLRVRRDQNGVWVEMPEQRVHFDDMLRVINQIWTDMGPLGIILGIENNGKDNGEKDITDADLLNRLLPNAANAIWRLTALTPEEGAEFLLRKGLHQVDEQDRRALSARLHGLPIALKAAAQEILYLSDLDREAYVANLIVGQSRDRAATNDFLNFFKGWLERHSSVEDGSIDADSKSAHPLAVLRLLAILHGAVSKQEIQEIVASGQLKRLSGRNFDYLSRGELPFVAIIDEKFELHAMVRKFLLDEMWTFVETDIFDQYTSRQELEYIHWKAALMHLRVLKNETRPESDTVVTVEAFVHHMIEQIRLIPRGQAGKNRRPSNLAGGRSNDIEIFGQRAGILSNARLWWIAYSEARKWLLDSLKTSTRIFGQFEAKARILGQLLDIAAREGINLPEGPPDLRKEVALCWMHAGKLQLAQDLLAVSPYAPRKQKRHQSDGDWLIACDRASVEASIRVRSGDVIDEIETALTPLVLKAVGVSEGLEEPLKPNEPIPPLQRGALRILSRIGDVALNAGKVAEAFDYFEKAQKIQRYWRPFILNGEAARRMCIAFIRDRNDRIGNMARANELIERNINHYLAYDSVGSNDIISFLILRATLARVGGDIAQATEHLERVRGHAHILRRQVTFLTRFEFDIEALRLGIVSGSDKEDLLSEAKRISLKMRNAAHNALRYEVDVVMAELLEGVDREQHCSALRKELRRVNHRLRLADLDMLATGVSPTLHFGA